MSPYKFSSGAACLAALIVVLGASACESIAGAGVSPGSGACLQKQWSVMNEPPSVEERRFDVEHDYHASGYSLSCRMSLTATEVQTFLNLFRQSVLSNDFEEIAQLAEVPVAVYSTNFVPGEDGVLTADAEVLVSTEALREFLESQVDYYRSFVTCIDLRETRLDPTWGFSIGGNAVWFGRTEESRAIKILSLYRGQRPSQALLLNCS